MKLLRLLIIWKRRCSIPFCNPYINVPAHHQRTRNDAGEIWIDLGQVHNLAEVWVNGKLAGTVWMPPFRVNINDEVKAGGNHVEIKSVDLWVNRLIGDEQPDLEEKITLTTRQFYRADSPLIPSGLIGPVDLINKKNMHPLARSE
jgi:hypothetical protein